MTVLGTIISNNSQNLNSNIRFHDGPFPGSTLVFGKCRRKPYTYVPTPHNNTPPIYPQIHLKKKAALPLHTYEPLQSRCPFTPNSAPELLCSAFLGVYRSPMADRSPTFPQKLLCPLRGSRQTTLNPKP